MYVYHSLSLSFIVDTLKAQNSGVSTVRVSSARLKVKEKGTVSLTVSSRADSLYRPPFCLNQIVSNNERKRWCSMKHAQLMNSNMSCLSRVLCSISNCLRKCDSKWEGWERIAEGREY